jgi:hypothetical protein
MKSQIVKGRAAKTSLLRNKTSVLQNTICVLANLALPFLVLSALTGAAQAQGAGSDLKAKDEADAKAMHQYIDRMENDQKYQEAIRNQQAPPASNDPWGAVRPTTTPAAGAKPAAKTATGTKTASGAKKAASGSLKPAPGPATSASGATAKSQ